MTSRVSQPDGAEFGFSFFIDDERYSVPTLRFACLAVLEACGFADELLAESRHYRSVQVRRDDQIVYRVERTGPDPRLA